MDPDRLSPAELAALIDHTLLRPEATAAEIDVLCTQARELGTASVCVNPRWTARVHDALAGSPVLTCAVIAFPFGIQRREVAVAEAERALEDGADELDVVAPLGAIADADWRTVTDDLAAVRAAAPAPTVLKAILETALWPDEVIRKAARAAADAGCDFVKTSTGFHPSGGATVAAVEALASSGLRVKASGGIRSWDTARMMLAAGADRLGCSATATIVGERVSAARGD